MFSLEKPSFFEEKNILKVGGAFIYDTEGKILLLHRNPLKPEGSTWGLPGGKIDLNETPEEGAIREIYEETGIVLSKIELIATLFVTKYDGFRFIYYLFEATLDQSTHIVLSPSEHIDYGWFNKKGVLKMNLIHDLPECIERWMK